MNCMGCPRAWSSGLRSAGGGGEVGFSGGREEEEEAQNQRAFRAATHEQAGRPARTRQDRKGGGSPDALRAALTAAARTP